MDKERIEWVEIIEPRTKEHMYANLTTGECVWDPPPGVPVKKTDNNQWWELFDQCTSRFYYYNATSQQTIWHRPSDCDIIPLAKLQTIKQNTEPESSNAAVADNQKPPEFKKKETVSTATQTPTVGRSSRFNINPALSGACKQYSPVASVDVQTSPPSPSPSRRHHHHHHHHNRHHRQNEQQVGPRRHHNHSQDSGRSSDSSVSHSRTSLESCSFRLLDSPHRHHPRPNQVPPGLSHPHRQPSGNTLELGHHKSGTFESAKGHKLVDQPPLSLSLSMSTPVFKKKTFADNAQNTNECRRSPSEFDKSKYGKENSRCSFGADSSTSPYRESPSESKGFRSEFSPYRAQEMQLNFSQKSQNEKYRPIMECDKRPPRERDRDRVNSLEKSNSQFHSQGHLRNLTKVEVPGPVSVRHHGSSSSFSEANIKEMHGQSISGRNEALKNIAKSTGVVSNVARQRSLDVLERDRDKNKELRRQATCSNAVESPQQQQSSRSSSYSQQHQQQKQQTPRKHDKEDDSMHERYLLNESSDQNIEHLSSNSCSSNTSNTSSNSIEPEETEDHNIPADDPSKKKRSNGNSSPPPSPYYGNLLVDADHLLPLQHYILQQAKLSGCYKFGDPLLAEEGDDSLDEEGGKGTESRGRTDEDSDDQFADDEAASNQGDSSSQEYLEDHYADLGTYDTAGLATYYNTADTLTRPQITPPPPPNFMNQTESRETVMPSRPVTLAASSAAPARTISLASRYNFDTADYDEGRREDIGPGGDIEKYAQDNLNLNCGRPKGLRILFRKKFSVRDILSWSKDPIPQPMLVNVEGEKLLKREACNLFRLVQVYMGDRKANVGMTLDSVAMEIVNSVYTKVPLRDELYVQICRQTTENPRKESLRRGWELMAICLAFVPPSPTFEPYLDGYMNRHRDPNFQFPEVAKWPIHVQVSHYATVACRRLQRIGAHGKRQPKKATCEDIDQARIQIFRASMFGGTLSEVMALQRDRFPQRELPWIQTTLTRQVLIRGGTMTEGIFRVSADADEVNALKIRLDKFEDSAILAASQDAHAPASLLKLWVRELYEPLIPDSFYCECVSMRHEDSNASAAKVSALVDRLPELNRRVLCHLIHFLQIFARPDVVARTKMDASNLAMVMAPNILRCTSHDPRVILENARKEMAFVRSMIETLETAWVEDLH